MPESAGERDTQPGSLAQRAQAGLLALGELADARNAAADLQTLKLACTRAEAATARLAVARAAAAELTDLGVPIQIKASEQVSAARRNLRTAATAAQNPETSLTNRLRAEATQTALKTAESRAGEFEGAMRRAVALEGARLRPPDLDTLASALPRGEAVLVRLSMLQRDFTGLPQDTSLHVLPDIVRRLREHADGWDETRAEAQRARDRLHPEVQAFMRAAATDAGAAWSMLTPTVRGWLDANGNGMGYRTRYVDGH